MAKNISNQLRTATRRKFSAEEKIRIVLEGLRGEIPISELARREGIAPSVSCNIADTGIATMCRTASASLSCFASSTIQSAHNTATTSC